ncbi:MAG: hypothetical protein ACPLRA_05670 [Candidatus Saccharicenans sp.]
MKKGEREAKKIIISASAYRPRVGCLLIDLCFLNWPQEPPGVPKLLGDGKLGAGGTLNKDE